MGTIMEKADKKPKITRITSERVDGKLVAIPVYEEDEPTIQ
jgi:hypothetical protein